MDSVVDLVNNLFTSEDAFDAVAETGRFLYVYNSTTLIASVGGIVAAILVASFLWIAISAALSGSKGYGGGYGGGSYRKRRAAEDAYGSHSFVELLALLDESFRKMEINSFECQKRAVCEAHLRHAESKLGPVARRIHFIFSKIERSDLSALQPESASFFEEYIEAANRGRNNLNCGVFYPSCNRSLRDHLIKTPNIL